MGKKKETTMPTDVAKALWELYANMIKDKWVEKLAYSIASQDMDAVRAVGRDMSTFKFDFNRSDK